MTIHWKWLIVNAIVAATAFLGGYWWHGLVASDNQAADTGAHIVPAFTSDVDSLGAKQVAIPIADSAAAYLLATTSNSNSPQVEPFVPQAADTTSLYFAVIGADAYNPNVPLTDYYIRIPAALSVREKCERLARELSLLKFRGQPIEVMSIEKRKGRSVAIINLREDEENQRILWRTGFFQGSAGGEGTTTTLIGTFLQRDYDGEWIDGVQFLYEGGPLDMFDHVPGLCDVTWRDTT